MYLYYMMGFILLPGLLIAIWAQSKVSYNYNKYSGINSKNGVTAAQLIRQLLDGAGMYDVQVVRISGHLTDHFNKAAKTIALSDGVYNSSSIAALGIACHEFGHALQWNKNYVPLKIRNFLIPVTNLLSATMWPLVIIGLFLNFSANPNTVWGSALILAGVIVFGLAVLVDLATLPVEYNASNRAIKLLKSSNTLDNEELKGAKKVLSAAALTYVAALLVSILNFLRFILVILASNRRD